ncbi:NADH-quinone oxidoreductase subunit J [Sphingosinithalassobacter portus]|uniref:NADH-quinone oxidoreductase subunit J n=1 Tax=Stakelama portus TaxID=2676234 RepID=UPI000D6E585D|nr:NADH-quinone oxidoreductase subunit J [Sphingosinithalassobacter portus]
MIQAIAFYLFAFVVIASAVMVIFSRNPVHSVLWLILAFFNAAGLMLIAGAEFIAMLLVIVYVGAVAVLFLFVVMMLNIDFAELRAGVARYAAVGLALAVALVAEIIIAVSAWKVGGIELGRRIAATDESIPNIEAVGRLLYSRYLFAFEAAGLILLVAMIGAIVLTYRHRAGVKPQNISAQINRRSKDAVRMVDAPVGKGVEL